MSASEFDELLSAYLDGEVTAQERALVEQSLERTPALRETLDELSEVSEAVRGLPASKLPADLSPRVLEAIRREPAPRASKSIPVTQPAGRRHWSVLGASVAAVCVLGVFFMTRKAGQNQDQDLVADNRASTGAAPSISGPASGVEVMEESRADLADASRANTSELLRDTIVNMQRRPELGEVLRILDDNASEIRVLEYVVADVDDSAGQIRTLLASNGIEPMNADALIVSSSPSIRSGDGVVDPNQRYLVYFEGEEAFVQNAVEDFAANSNVLSVNDYGVLSDVEDAAEPRATDTPAPAPASEPMSLAADATDADSVDQVRPPTEPESASFAAKRGAAGIEKAAQEGEKKQASQEQAPLAEPFDVSATVVAEEKLDAAQIQKFTYSNGLQVEIPPEAAEPVINQVQSRAPINQYGPTQQSRARRGYFNAPAQKAEQAGTRSVTVSRVLVILQHAPVPAAEPATESVPPAPEAPPSPPQN